MELDKLKEVHGQDKCGVIWCGDLNAHNTLWGGRHIDVTGQVVEDLIEERELVCLNDGRGTRIDVHTGIESVLDLTLVSNNLASKCNWDMEESSMGSDHYPIVPTLDIDTDRTVMQGRERWVFEKANWTKFEEMCEAGLIAIDSNQGIDNLNGKVCAVILEAVAETIPRSKGIMKRKAVPWWTDKCGKAVRDRNKEFKLLKRTHNYKHLI